MKKFSFLKNTILVIIYFFIFSLMIYVFSFYSISKGKVYDIFWIKSIQENLYWKGFIKSFQCVKYSEKLAYVPREGKCRFKNVEFDTILTFTKYFRKNENNIKFHNNDLSPIAVLGDSFAMGWGVNNTETFSAILERNLKRKVYNFGVSGYGTYRGIIRFLESPYYKTIDKIIIQYNYNDIEENRNFDDKKAYTKNDLNFLTNIQEMNRTEKVFFALRRFKTVFRLLYREIKIIFVKKQQPSFKIHLEEFLKVLEKYNYLDGKEIIFFYTNSHNLQFKDYETKKYKNIDFVNVDLNNKKHYFVLDDHLKVEGHIDLANQITEIVRKKGW